MCLIRRWICYPSAWWMIYELTMLLCRLIMSTLWVVFCVIYLLIELFTQHLSSHSTDVSSTITDFSYSKIYFNSSSFIPTLTMMRPTRTQTLTEKGRELLERNLCGKCNAALRSANTIANKLNPLLESADVSDFSLVRRYKDELELCIIQIISPHDDFQAKFAGDLETLAPFSLWFQPRFEVLQKLLYFTRDWLAKNTKCDVDDNVRPEDSVSQVASVEDNCTGRSSVHRSSSGSHSSRKSCASSSSIKSARIKESLKKVSLLAEANTLFKKQDFLRKELELSLEKESLELSTKLAIATAKEEVLLYFNVENSVVTTSQLDKKTSDAKFKMVTDHIGQAGVEFVHPTTDSVCPVKIEMDSCTRQASLPENSETRRVEFTERKFDLGRSNLNFSAAQTVVKSASTPVDGLVEKQDEDQVCNPLLVHNAAVSAAAGDLNTTDFSRYETRSRVSVSPDQVCMKSGSSNATHTFSTPVTMTPKLNPCIPAFVPQETGHFHRHNFDAEINGDGRLTTLQHMPHKDFHSYIPVKHSYGHSSDAVVGPSGGHSGAGGYIAPDSQFGVVLDRLSDVLADSRNRLPEVVIPKFSGDPLDFASFVRSFDSRIASRTSDEGERHYYLEQFTVGTAREIVCSCMHMSLELAYQEARRRLERRFGDKFLLSQAYIGKLESWSAICNDDVKRLDEFTTFLVGCSNAMTCSDSTGNLTIHPVWDWSLVNFLVTCKSAGLLRVMLRLFLDWCLFWKMRPGSNWILCLVKPCLVLWVTPKVLQRSPLQFQVLGRSLHQLLLLSSKKHRCQVPTVVLHVCSVHYNIHLSVVGGFRKFFTKPRFPFWCETSCVLTVSAKIIWSHSVRKRLSVMCVRGHITLFYIDPQERLTMKVRWEWLVVVLLPQVRQVLKVIREWLVVVRFPRKFPFQNPWMLQGTPHMFQWQMLVSKQHIAMTQCQLFQWNWSWLVMTLRYTHMPFLIQGAATHSLLKRPWHN